MYSGTVRNWFDSNRGEGYGFIIPDLGGDDVFVHRQHVVNANYLTSGDTVTYEVEMNPRKNKPQAVRVTLVEQRSSKWAVSSTGHSSHSWHGYPAEPQQRGGHEASWANAWDPPKWDSDLSANDDLEPTSEPPNQEVLVPQEAEAEEPEPVAAAAAIVPFPIPAVTPTVAASGRMHLPIRPLRQTFVCPCNGQGHTVP